MPNIRLFEESPHPIATTLSQYTHLIEMRTDAVAVFMVYLTCLNI